MRFSSNEETYAVERRGASHSVDLALRMQQAHLSDHFLLRHEWQE